MKITCNIHVATVCKLTKSDARRLLTGECGGGLLVSFPEPITGGVTIDYPLKNPDIHYVENEVFFGELIWEICNRYKEIYQSEYKTMKSLESNEALLNRGTSDGNYGIWGHGIEDLYIEGVEINGEKIKLSVGS